MNLEIRPAFQYLGKVTSHIKVYEYNGEVIPTHILDGMSDDRLDEIMH